jgi:hypothetical protein
MTINFPGPYEIRMFYTCSVGVTTLQHEARYNLNLETEPTPGDEFGAINALERSGAPVDLAVYVEAWVDLFLALYVSTACVVSHAELWRYEAGTFSADFISAYDIAEAGVGGSNLVPGGQYIMTFRTLEGGIMKLNFLETVIATGSTDTPPFANAAAEAIRLHVLSVDNVWLARDTSYPFASIAAYPGINEAIFKRRFRPN